MKKKDKRGRNGKDGKRNLGDSEKRERKGRRIEKGIKERKWREYFMGLLGGWKEE